MRWSTARSQAGRRTAILGLLAVMTAAGCGDDGGSAAAQPGPESEVEGSVAVLAAASLTETFERLRDRLAEQHPGLEIALSFGPSSGLVEQLIAGAPADVLATADTRTMDTAVDSGVVDGAPRIFARNTLTLVVPPGNPGGVTGLADLARDELAIAVCEPQVPCGAAAAAVLDDAGVEAAPDTLTTDVKEALALVTLGEADAALVYLTDAAAAGDDVQTLDIPGAQAVVNTYAVALVADAPNPDAAAVVVEALTNGIGQDLLREAGFGEP